MGLGLCHLRLTQAQITAGRGGVSCDAASSTWVLVLHPHSASASAVARKAKGYTVMRNGARNENESFSGIRAAQAIFAAVPQRRSGAQLADSLTQYSYSRM